MELYKNEDYNSLLASYSTNSTASKGEVFDTSSVKDEVSSMRVSETCAAVLMYDEDACDALDSDNVLVSKSVASLPWDLDNDVCKISMRRTTIGE